MPILTHTKNYIDYLVRSELLNAQIANKILPDNIKSKTFLDAKGQYVLNLLACAHEGFQPDLSGVVAPDFRFAPRPSLGAWLKDQADKAFDQNDTIWCSYYPDGRSPIKYPWAANHAVPLAVKYIGSLLALRVANIRCIYGAHISELVNAKSSAAKQLGIPASQYYGTGEENVQIMALVPVDKPLTKTAMAEAAGRYLTQIRRIVP